MHYSNMANYIIISILLLLAGNSVKLTAASLISISQLKSALSELMKTKSTAFLDSVDPRVRLLPHELITHYGYEGENHTVQTADGYILALHRVVRNKNKDNLAGKPVVLIQHGIVCSAMDWIITGPNRGLALILADSGFDVWLANSRGNRYSRAHKTKTPDQKEFWDFSWHEMGIYDLPAVIDYILMKTKKEKLMYIGHSQGTAISYVLLSERPEYNKKISALFSLAPISYVTHLNSLLKPVTANINLLNEIFGYIQFYELKDWNTNMKSLIYRLCNKDIPTQEICKDILFLLGGLSEEQFDKTLFPLILQHFPAGSSVKQFIHFGQLINSGRFSQFDYGSANNMKYNSNLPPDYKLKNIKIPTTLIYAANDLLSIPQDVQQLYNDLAVEKKLVKINDAKFNHFDFMWGKYVKSLVYEQLISLMLKHVT